MARKKIIYIAIAVLCVVIIALYFHHNHKQNHAAIPPLLVRAQKPLVQSIPMTISATGNLVAINSTTLTPRASGYIKSINVHEGEAVRQGQILFKLDNQTQKDALTAAQASYAFSKLQYAQNKKLLAKGYVTRDAEESAKAALKENIAALQTAEKNFNERDIIAPFNGTVGALPLSIGDYVNPGNKLTTFVDTTHLRAQYALPAENISQLKLGQAVTISNSAQQHSVAAIVSYISPAINTVSQTISVHAHVNNANNIFKPGEYIAITQQLGDVKNALLIPEQSVLASINGYSVFVVKNNKAIRVPIKIGAHINGNVVILSGLKPTDEVMTAGQNQVKNKQPVKLV